MKTKKFDEADNIAYINARMRPDKLLHPLPPPSSADWKDKMNNMPQVLFGGLPMGEAVMPLDKAEFVTGNIPGVSFPISSPERMTMEFTLDDESQTKLRGIMNKLDHGRNNE